MKSLKYLLTVLLVSPFFINAQVEGEVKLTAEQALAQEKIETQFDYVVKKSGNFQEYKVVKKVWLNQLKSNIVDTLKTLDTKLNNSKDQIDKQQTTITNLESSLKETNESLASVTLDKDSINFFGASVSKGTYKTIMWAIVGSLILLLGFFIFKFKNSNHITIQAKKALAETEIEFEDHRRIALEREQKVRRQLQDEINKQRKKAGAKK